MSVDDSVVKTPAQAWRAAAQGLETAIGILEKNGKLLEFDRGFVTCARAAADSMNGLAERAEKREVQALTEPDPTFDIGQRTLRVVDFNVANPTEGEYNGDDTGRIITADLTEATVVSSDMTVKNGFYHQPVIDFDIPVRLVPSSTPGHSHLYIDTPTDGPAYFALLRALVECGYVQPGYADASERRGHSDVRLPWIKKAVQA